ncbi:MAG: hypothetical protein WB579_11320, partial [Bryobacteraceae bacterium]
LQAGDGGIQVRQFLPQLRKHFRQIHARSTEDNTTTPPAAGVSITSARRSHGRRSAQWSMLSRDTNRLRDVAGALRSESNRHGLVGVGLQIAAPSVIFQTNAGRRDSVHLGAGPRTT